MIGVIIWAWIGVSVACVLGFYLGHKVGYSNGYHDGYWAEEDGDDGQPAQGD